VFDGGVVKDRGERDSDGRAAAVLGLKYLKPLMRDLKKLRAAAAAAAHGNRELFPDDLVVAYLIAFFNPAVRSLRTLEDLSAAAAVRAHLSVARVCRSTASDANALFDPTLLDPLVARLRAQLPDLKQRDGPLGRLLKSVVLVDGSFFAAAADVAFAITRRNGRSGTKGPARPKVRLDLHLAADTLTPVKVAVSGKGKDQSEPRRAARAIERGAIYVYDRGFVSFALFDAVIDGGADLVARAKADVNFTAREEAHLDAEDHAAGVISDRIGRLGGSPHCKAPRQELREVWVADPAAGPDAPAVRLITTLLDLPARVIAALYRWRWQIELFFRWLKVHANFRHLTSHSRAGMTLGFYVAVIAVLLMYQYTGRPVSKYAYTMLSLVAAGVARPDEALAILAARERERANDRKTTAARKAKRAAAAAAAAEKTAK
jgi:hypothetical protein